jgi:hypothetical protein
LIDLLGALLDNGKTAAEIDGAFKVVSPIGEQFGKQAKEYERTRNELQRSSTDNEPLEPARKTELSSVGKSDERTGRAKNPSSQQDFAERSRNLGSGLLEPTGSKSLVPNQKLTPARIAFNKEQADLETKFGKIPPTIDDVLFSIPPDDEMPADEELEKQVESNTKKLLKLIYDGKRDVTVPEAIVNTIRAGLLLSVKVVKNNATSNTLMQLSELGAKPFMATFDRLNPRSKGRTVSGITPTGIFEGLFGKKGAFREGLFGSQQGLYGALRHGVTDEEALRFELSSAKDTTNPQFIRSTGVPLLDVIIEAAKRISAAGDRPFKAFSRTQELHGIAKAIAKNEKAEGLAGNWRKRMRELKADPTPLMLEMIKDYSEITTFQNSNYGIDAFNKVRKTLVSDKELEKLIPNAAQRKAAKVVLGAAYVGLSQIAPFVQTPVNVGIRSLEYFAPIGVVKAAWQFFQIGKGAGRKAWLEDKAAKRNSKIARLEKLREREDKNFDTETDRITKGYQRKFDARQKLFDAEIEKVSLVTDKYRREHEKMLAEKRKKNWNQGWQESFDKYQKKRSDEKGKINDNRDNTDDATQRSWADENAAADLGFTMHESRRFAEAAGRAGFGATVGGLLLLAIAYAALEAVGTTDDDEDEKSKAKYKDGIPDDSIRIGNYRFKFSSNPFGYALKMGVNLLEQYNRPGTGEEKAGAAGKRFVYDILESNPFSDGYTGKYQHKDLASDIGSRLSAPIPRILSEIGEVMDDKPRKYWDDGFGAQFLYRLPYGREFLPESESFIGGIENRGDGWRRFLRLIDPVDTTKETAPQSSLPNTPLSKYSDPAPLKEKLKSADTGDVLKYYNQFKDRMKPGEVVELKRLLKSKADNANEKGTLTDEEKQNIKKSFPDLNLKEVMPKLPRLKKLPSQFDNDEDSSSSNLEPDLNENLRRMKNSGDAESAIEVFQNSAESQQPNLLPVLKERLAKSANATDKAQYQKAIKTYEEQAQSADALKKQGVVVSRLYGGDVAQSLIGGDNAFPSIPTHYGKLSTYRPSENVVDIRPGNPIGDFVTAAYEGSADDIKNAYSKIKSPTKAEREVIAQQLRQAAKEVTNMLKAPNPEDPAELRKIRKQLIKYYRDFVNK